MAYSEQQIVGVIKRIVLARGFGFIAVAGSRDEYFFHQSALLDARLDTLREGQAVTFVPTRGQNGKGPRAESISLS